MISIYLLLDCMDILLIPQVRVVERHEHTLVDGIAAVGQYYFNFTVAFAVVDRS